MTVNVLALLPVVSIESVAACSDDDIMLCIGFKSDPAPAAGPLTVSYTITSSGNFGAHLDVAVTGPTSGNYTYAGMATIPQDETGIFMEKLMLKPSTSDAVWHHRCAVRNSARRPLQGPRHQGRG